MADFNGDALRERELAQWRRQIRAMARMGKGLDEILEALDRAPLTDAEHVVLKYQARHAARQGPLSDAYRERAGELGD